MRRIALVGVALLCLASASWAASDKVKKSSQKVPNQFIVVLNDDVADVDALADELSLKHGGLKDHVYKNAVKGFSVKMSDALAEALSNDPRVQYVEEDGWVYAMATQTGATWGLDRIDQRALPLNSTYTYDRTGAGVKAYVLDTGILGSHTDFGGRVISGFDAVGGGTTDCNGHGTHVSGTIGGATWGVAKAVTLVAVRVLNCAGSGTTAGVVAGIDWVTSDHLAGQSAVANMSLGGGASAALDTAVRNSIADGVTYALAAGNETTDACTRSPARVGEGITVGSTTSTDARSSFSNFGTCLDLFAPGSSITSAWYTSTTATNTISGTSMAAPHVAGVAALYLEANPGEAPATVAQALRDNATPNVVGSPGTGSPNRLLYSLFGGAPPPPPPPPTGDFSLSVSPSSRSVSRSGSVTYTVTITRTDGFAGAVSLSVSGQPAGATAAFNPNPASGASSTLTVTVANGTRRATYPLTITGTSGSLTHTASASLTVTK